MGRYHVWGMAGLFYTVGHSTHSIAEFAGLLQGAGVGLVVDVRSVPRSRTNPQFNADALPQTLVEWQIGYQHLRKLGGLRSRAKGEGASVNLYWENKSFRNYADYTATEPFREGLRELEKLGATNTCAIMCAEAVWWRCHRRIISDYLLSDGARVFHIMGLGKLVPAVLNPAAVRRQDGTLIYPAGEPGA